MKNIPKQAILFLSNKTSQSIIKEFNLLSASIGDLADVYFIYHQTTPNIPEEIQSLNYYPFTNEILHELNFIPLENSLLPGCDHFPLFKFYLEHPYYDYYWHMEDDVRFRGEWRYFFESFQNQNADFISNLVRTKQEQPHWYWWNSLTKDGESVPLENAVRSFNAIHRMSNRAIKFLHTQLSDGWRGHHEVVMPTLLYQNDFKIIDFGGDGSFVPKGNKHKFYTNDSMTHIPITFGDVKNRIYHPVKEFRKNCVIVVVEKNSIRPQWLNKHPNFDLHLIVTEDYIAQRFRIHTAYVFKGKGEKQNLVKNYLSENQEYLEIYNYLLVLNSDILIDNNSIERLFGIMEKRNLSEVYPSLIQFDSDNNGSSKTNISEFSDLHISCYSRKALKRLLFSENNKGRTEYYKSNNEKNIFLSKEIYAIPADNARLLGLKNFDDLEEYFAFKNNCKMMIAKLTHINDDEFDNTETADGLILSLLNRILIVLFDKVDEIIAFGSVEDKYNFVLILTNHSELIQCNKLLDLAFIVYESILVSLSALKKDRILSTNEISQIGSLIEFLAQNKYIENETDMILEDIIFQINKVNLKELEVDQGLLNIGIYCLSRMNNPKFSLSNEKYSKEKEMLENIVVLFQCELHKRNKNNSDMIDREILFIARVLLFFAQYNTAKYKKVSLNVLEEDFGFMENFCSKRCKENTESQISPNHNYLTLLCAYALFCYYESIDNEEKSSKIINLVLEYSKKRNKKELLNNNTQHEIIKLIYIYYSLNKKITDTNIKKQFSDILISLINNSETNSFLLESTKIDIAKIIRSGLLLASLHSANELKEPLLLTSI